MQSFLKCISLTLVILFSAFSGCFGSNTTNQIVEQRGVPGGLLKACLHDDKYTSMVIEIDYAEGFEPEDSSIDLLQLRLDQICDKPDGITITKTKTVFEIDDTWTADDVRSEAYRTRSASPYFQTDVLTWHILMPAGEYSDDSVLGVAVNAADIAVFKSTIQDSENIISRPSAEEIENSVMLHEIGHLLGLVNCVYQSDIDHEDPEHPKHSNNEDSVMHWAIESSSIGNIIDGELPDDFDSADKSDLAKLKSGELQIDSQLWMP